jgi:biopolymer transport protein ExbD
VTHPPIADRATAPSRPARWLVALLLCLGPACEDVEARERHEREQRERLLEMDAHIARLEARLARLETPPPPPEVAPPRPLNLELTADAMSLDGVPVEPSRLAALLRERVAAAKPNELSLSLRAAPNLPHARVVEVIDLAKTAGVGGVALSTTAAATAVP